MAITTLNAIPSLAYEEIGHMHKGNLTTLGKEGKGRGNEPRNMLYCTYHRTHGHGTNDKMSRLYHLESMNLRNNRRATSLGMRNVP